MARLILMFLATTNVFVLLYAPQPLLPLFSSHFHISKATASLAISVTIMMLAFASLLLAPVSDRIERKKVILVSSVLLIVPSVAIFLCTSFGWLLFWRALLGLVIPGTTAILMAYASEEFPKEQRGRVMGTYVSATVAGGLLGRVIAGPIALYFSWQTVFGFTAISSAVITLLISRYLPPSQNQAKRGTQSLWAHFGNPALVGTFLIGFSQFFAFIGFFTYIPFYVSRAPFNLGITQVSLLYGTYIFGMLSAPAAGFLSDRIGRRSTMAIGHMIGATGILLTLWPNLFTLILGSSLLTLGNFASQSATTAYVTDTALHSRGAATSLYNVFFYLGGSLGAWLPGIFWTKYQWHGLVSMTVVTIACALLLNFLLAGKTSWHMSTAKSTTARN